MGTKKTTDIFMDIANAILCLPLNAALLTPSGNLPTPQHRTVSMSVKQYLLTLIYFIHLQCANFL